MKLSKLKARAKDAESLAIDSKFFDKLIAEGQRLVNEAFESAEFRKNKTQNLHDSYGSCVYFRGKEYPNSRRFVGEPKALVAKKWYGQTIEGRKEINKFFDTYRPPSDKIYLIIAAAMPYATILENQGDSLIRKYKVIAGISSELDHLAGKYNGKVINI